MMPSAIKGLKILPGSAGISNTHDPRRFKKFYNNKLSLKKQCSRNRTPLSAHHHESRKLKI
ncbi:uncharacterized protein Dmul_16570 [Desulfococcus multivorans]|nr:uncharacterized protein Dmul_16570 [Desulfococcus multivorans]